MTINDIPSAPLAQPCPAYRPPAVFEVSSTDSIGTKSASSSPFNGNGSASSSTACVSAIGSDTTDSSATLTTLSHGQQKWQPQSFSTSRLVAAHIGAALTLFLATTDTTIVSTSLPTIAATLHGTQADYTWVGVAYMLTQTACQPLYGRLSDLLGRKCVLFTSILIFAIGSLLCGAAQNITWLILARGLSGVGGGGIVSCVWVITSEIVETEKRAKWSQALSVTWSCSAVAGPLLGGIFSGETSQPSILTWRWAFYLNLPICFVATIVLGLSLRGSEVDHLKNVSWHTFIMKFDFLGLMLFISGSSAIIVGFSFAASFGWLAPSTLALVITGIIVLVLGGVYEAKTTREALFPPTAFKNINVVIILLINFLHNFAFTSGTFYLARFYQLSGSRTILESSLMVLPYSLGSSLASMPAAWFMDYYQAKSGNLNGQRMVIVSGLIVATTGFGLLELLRQGTSPLFQAMIPLIAGIGLGMLFHAPYQVFSRALPPKLLATGTSAFFLVRFTGATIGLALSGAMYSAFTDVEVDSARERLSHGELRSASQAIRYVWVLCTPLLGVALLVSIFLRHVDTTKTKIGDTESTTDTTFHEKGAVTAIPAN